MTDLVRLGLATALLAPTTALGFCGTSPRLVSYECSDFCDTGGYHYGYDDGYRRSGCQGGCGRGDDWDEADTDTDGGDTADAALQELLATVDVEATFAVGS